MARIMNLREHQECVSFLLLLWRVEDLGFVIPRR